MFDPRIRLPLPAEALPRVREFGCVATATTRVAQQQARVRVRCRPRPPTIPLFRLSRCIVAPSLLSRAPREASFVSAISIAPSPHTALARGHESARLH